MAAWCALIHWACALDQPLWRTGRKACRRRADHVAGKARARPATVNKAR